MKDASPSPQPSQGTLWNGYNVFKQAAEAKQQADKEIEAEVKKQLKEIKAVHKDLLKWERLNKALKHAEKNNNTTKINEHQRSLNKLETKLRAGDNITPIEEIITGVKKENKDYYRTDSKGNTTQTLKTDGDLTGILKKKIEEQRLEAALEAMSARLEAEWEAWLNARAEGRKKKFLESQQEARAKQVRPVEVGDLMVETEYLQFKKDNPDLFTLTGKKEGQEVGKEVEKFVRWLLGDEKKEAILYFCGVINEGFNVGEANKDHHEVKGYIMRRILNDNTKSLLPYQIGPVKAIESSPDSVSGIALPYDWVIPILGNQLGGVISQHRGPANYKVILGWHTHPGGNVTSARGSTWEDRPDDGGDEESLRMNDGMPNLIIWRGEVYYGETIDKDGNIKKGENYVGAGKYLGTYYYLNFFYKSGSELKNATIKIRDTRYDYEYTPGFLEPNIGDNE